MERLDRFLSEAGVESRRKIKEVSRSGRVTVNGENAIQLADRSSSFTKMAMSVGKNEFRFSCDNPENRSLAKVTVEHYKKYLGV